MKNLPYLLWAYVLIGLLISVYGMSLVRRFRQVAHELETLAAALRARRVEAVPPRAVPPPSQPPT